MALENSPPTQAASSEPRTGSYPLIYARCLHKHPAHLHICLTVLSHTCSSPQALTLTYVHPLHTSPHSAKPGIVTHTPVTYTCIHTHPPPRQVIITHTPTHLGFPCHTHIPSDMHSVSLSHTQQTLNHPLYLYIHACVYVHNTHTHQLSALSHHPTHQPIYVCPGQALQLPKRTPTS